MGLAENALNHMYQIANTLKHLNSQDSYKYAQEHWSHPENSTFKTWPKTVHIIKFDETSSQYDNTLIITKLGGKKRSSE